MPDSVGAFGSLTSLALPAGVSALPESIFTLTSLTSLTASGLTSVPEGIGDLASLTSLRLADGVTLLPPSGCTAEMAAHAFFSFRCLSGAELAAGLDLTADAAEVATLLDFCSANPGMSYYETPICGSGRLGSWAQWGNGDPCAGDYDDDGWLGVTCDAAREHITDMCALLPRCLPVWQPLTREAARAQRSVWSVAEFRPRPSSGRNRRAGQRRRLRLAHLPRAPRRRRSDEKRSGVRPGDLATCR